MADLRTSQRVAAGPKRSSHHATPPYSTAQRWLALGYGLLTHAIFVVAIGAMFFSLHSGLAMGRGRLRGWMGFAANFLLLSQFALAHSVLLGDRGRKWMSRLAPLGLGRALSTTLFAGISSVQLLLVFLLWSPSQVLWSAPSGWLLYALNALYAGSWLLLIRSMHDAGMDVQMGSLGWRSVWRNEPPVYKPFSRGGTFRHLRQPIYLSFTLILWTGPVWTLDHVCAALLWTTYCVAAPLLKEKRYLRYYGDAFLRYQSRVPYWIPRLRSRPQTHTAAAAPAAPADYDVVIAGAGPVGLLLANLLAQRGRRVQVFERSEGDILHSQAIGITPPSLEILRQLHLDAPVIQQGIPIDRVMVHGQTGRLGVCDFTRLDGPYPFVLSVPQHVVMKVLRENLLKYPHASLSYGSEVTALTQDPSRVMVTVSGAAGDHVVTSSHVVACDGARGDIRRLLHIRSHGGSYGCHFLMADFPDSSCLGEEAHLFFTSEGAVESFPLPGKRRRWVAQMNGPAPEVDASALAAIVRHRTGISVPKPEGVVTSAFSPRWMQCETYHDGRVFLCGDAAHVMSPIGGQGMNTGFADAEFLTLALLSMQVDAEPAKALAWSLAYDRIRSKASRIATRRAAWGMKLGTMRGRFTALARDLFMREALFDPAMADTLASWFSMGSIPARTLNHVPQDQLPAVHRS
ncbi:MAG: FAD-dependent monooxygenase [Roseimicrobium sp.]